MKKNIFLLFLFFVTILNAQVANPPSNFEICDDNNSTPTSPIDSNDINDGIMCFDLSFKNSEVLGSQNPSNYIITYHLSQADANTGTNPLPLTFCNTTNPQTLYVRLQAITTGAFDTTNFMLSVTNAPMIPDAASISLSQCDEPTSIDGFTTFNLTALESLIYGSQSTLDNTLGYFESEADAFANTNTISNITSYTNTTPNQMIFIRMTNNITGCFTVGFFNLIVEAPATLNQPTSLEVCDSNNDEIEVFDLTVNANEITNGNNAITLQYYASQADLNNDTPITNPMAFTNVSNPQIIFVRAITGVSNCASDVTMTIRVHPTPAPVNTTPLELCDDTGSGIGTFSLSDKIQEITNGNSNYIVTFHETQQDADTNTNALPNIYTNTTAFSQTIYARVANSSGCYSLTSLELIVTSNACNTSTEVNYEVETIPYTLYTINAVSTANLDDIFTPVIDIPFDFNFFGENYNQFTIGTNGLITFETQLAGNQCAWQMDVSKSIPSTELYVNSIFGVYHDMDNSLGGSVGYGVIGEAPFRKMVVFFDEVNQYAQDCNGNSTMQMIIYETFNVVDVQVKQKISCAAWNNGLGLIGIQNQSGTAGYAPQGRNTGSWNAINEGHRFKPLATYENIFTVHCDDNTDGFLMFDLSTINTDVLGDITSGTVTYYGSEGDLLNETNTLPMLYTNTSNTQKIYARIVNNATNEVTIKTVTLSVISCAEDYDADGVTTMDEDVNMDGNLGNDDTDGDGIPDFIDEDDDGDYILTNVELINTATGLPENSFLDTDGDMIPNHRDNDDDGDGTLTINEDYNGNNNPEDDDTNNNGVPDYLDAEVFLSVNEFSTGDMRMFPNPVKDKITIETTANVRIQNIEIYSIEGRLVHTQNQVVATNSTTINVSDFASGFYVLHLKTPQNTTLTKQFIIE